MIGTLIMTWNLEDVPAMDLWKVAECKLKDGNWLQWDTLRVLYSVLSKIVVEYICSGAYLEPDGGWACLRPKRWRSVVSDLVYVWEPPPSCVFQEMGGGTCKDTPMPKSAWG
ncbi:uncharacterized protein LOC130943508 [Arachis stenosperma]|uniref:uncharacterized protein LOC130943508 n=1 Tax=Arachis stenosperma TaxID=217475 RepID=UPI0025AB9EC5|nr:uncharacterized protein LOC130943508 [Arachis stenosperma]